MSDRDDDDLPLHLKKKRRRDVVSSARSTTAGVCIPSWNESALAIEPAMLARAFFVLVFSLCC
jgi:hypothetical protein